MNITLLLFVLGMMVDMIWILGDDNNEKFEEAYKTLSEVGLRDKTISILIIVVTFFCSLLWPIDVVIAPIVSLANNKKSK